MLRTVFGSIESALKKGGVVAVFGFGRFAVSKRKPRTGRNPRTGEPVKIAAKKVVRFKPAAGLSTAVN